MKTHRNLFAWLGVVLVAALVIAWAFPKAFPQLPADWQLNREEARRTALALFEDLGPVSPDSKVVARLAVDTLLEGRLMHPGVGLEEHAKEGSRLVAGVVAWEVTVYPPKALTSGWSHRALLAPSGEILELRVNPAADLGEGGMPNLGSPQATAAAFLSGLGLEGSGLSIPILKTRDLPPGVDRALRYTSPAEQSVFGETSGIDVLFAGQRLTGMSSWYESTGGEEMQALLQPGALRNLLEIAMVFLFLPLAGVAFVRRYHAGEVGVHTALKILLLCFGAGLLGVILTASGMAEVYKFPIFSRAQLTWVVAIQLLMFHFVPVAVVAFLAWSVGESFCQERWPEKLAAVVSLRQGQWRNATVALSSLRGLAAGLGLSAAVLLFLLALRPSGIWGGLEHVLSWSMGAPWPGVAHLSLGLAGVLYKEPFLLLFVLVPLVARFGRWPAVLGTCAIGALAFSSGFNLAPVVWLVVLGLLTTGALVALFLRFDLLTTLIASFLLFVLPACLVMLHTEDPWLQLQGCLPLAVAALPLALSARWLASGKTFVYNFDDVPAHVRRIAQRERQSLELETARSIQSSILPQLPATLAGVEISHAYRPATEVGGDFYDVLALEDGRLAVAVGDVAGHGVSSGLIMSMAKSALAVQVAYDPEVTEVFSTLNRMVYQSARRRLLATLSYLVLDPSDRSVHYASAGHVAPYLVGANGGVQALESIAYPLGARSSLRITASQAKLAAGDCLFLYSDGLVEARATGSDELYGFDRLEASLQAHAGKGAPELRDAVLQDLTTFTGTVEREDDQTLLVLRVP